MRTITLRVDDVESAATLADGNAVADAFWSILPLRADLFSANWSGHAGTFAAPAALLAAVETTIGPDNAVPVGGLAVASRENGGVVLIAYGPTMHHTALGPAPVSVFGDITANKPEFLARLERIFAEGAVTLTVDRA